MNERLFGTNRNYEDSGDFTDRYFYELRGCVAPKVKKCNDNTPAEKAKAAPKKSRREIAMDAARKKVNQRRAK